MAACPYMYTACAPQFRGFDEKCDFGRMAIISFRLASYSTFEVYMNSNQIGTHPVNI